MKKIIALLFYLVFQVSGNCQTDYFPNLIKIDIKGEGARFGYEANSFKLINKSCRNLPKDDFYYCEDVEFLEGYKLGEFRSEKLKSPLTITFTSGMSEDPTFVIFDNKNKVIANITALEFYINSSGVIYTAGHTNNMFDKRRKFEIRNDTIIEISQPFYYVGLKTVTTNNITLFSSTELKEIVAQIPKGYEVEVLAAETKRDFEPETLFLIKTKFGLIGWFKIEGVYDTKIKGLFYAGD